MQNMTKKIKSKLALPFVMFFFAISSQAQETNSSVSSTSSSTELSSPEGSTQTKIENIKVEEKPKKFGITAQIEGSSNLIEGGSYESSRETSYMVIPKYKISDKIALGAIATFVHNLKQVEESDFNNTEVSATYEPITLISDQLTIKPVVAAVLPTHKADRDELSLLGGIGLKQALMYNMTTKLKLPANITYGASARRNLHEYNRSNVGSPNSEYSFSNFLLLEVDLGKKLSFATKGTALSSLTYTNTWRSKFEIFEELSYQVTNAAYLTLGHVNTDATLKSNMSDSNIEVFNNNTSSIYLDAGVTY